MERSGRWILGAAFAITLASAACGDSADKNVDDPMGGDDSKEDAGGGITIGGDDAGSGANGGGGNGASGSNGAGGCTGQGQQCMCSDGQMGFQACMNGTLGECTCSIDLSDAGLPAPTDCLTGASCQSTMGFIKGVAGFCSPASDGAAPAGPAIPPMCATKADCDAEGLPGATCALIMLPVVGAQQLCVQPCTPAP